MRTQALFVAMLLALAPLPSVAQNFDVGSAAAGRGDYVAALREWTPLAEQGDARSQFNLGLMYSRGLGTVQDDAEAVRWYRASASQGDANAQFGLSMNYGLGKGVLQDYIVAHMWANIAASNGHDVAIEGRNYLASLMSQTDISEAQRRARVCMETNYQDCG